MSVYSTTRNALGLAAAAAALAACSGAATSAGAPGFVPSAQSSGASASAILPRPGSWMAPGTAEIRRLLYVSNGPTGSVLVYNYDTGKQVGELADLANPVGQCVDAKGDVYIADGGRNALVEYKRASIEQIRTLSTPGHPVGCSIAPNGNIAAASNPDTSGNAPPAITVWSTPITTPTVRSASAGCKRLASPGYDGQSHLYVGCDGGLYELPSAGGTLTPVALEGGGPGGPTSLMWDGKYLALTSVAIMDRSQTRIFQAVATSASTMKVVGETNLTDTCHWGSYVAQPFIVGNVNTPSNREQATAIVGGDDSCAGSVFYWSYPAGGNPTKMLSPAPDHATGASVSIATIPPPGK